MVEIVSVALLVVIIITLATSFKGAPFVPVDKGTLDTILKLSMLGKGDMVADIGSGDGRILIALARKGMNAHGYEINPFLVLWSKLKIARLGLGSNARVHWKNLWTVNYSEYNLVTVFGINYIMLDLEKKLRNELKSGSKVVAYSYPFPHWKSPKQENGVYLYIVK